MRVIRIGMTEDDHHAITDDEQQLTSTYSDSAVSFLQNDKSRSNDNNDESRIHELDLPQGLIELLVENNFTLESILNASSSELSKTLGIDHEIAAIICAAANKKNIRKGKQT